VEQPEVTDETADSTLVQSTNQQERNLQEKIRGNIELLKARMAEDESSIETLQEEKPGENDEFAESLQSGYSEPSEQFRLPAAEVSAYATAGIDNNTWIVHLSAYYGKPPPDIELEYLRDAAIPYEVVEVILSGKVWYRVLVSGFMEYGDAKEYAEKMKNRFGIKKIWISNMQMTFD